jgi:hypothetical protein
MSNAQSLSSRQDQWQDRITAWQQSGLSQAAFCQANQLSYHQFIYWRQKLLPNPTETATTQQLLPVQCVPESGNHLSITLPNGLRIQGIDANNLALLTHVLQVLS